LDGGDLSDDYVTALVEASLYLASRGDGPFAAFDMLQRTLDLLRALAAAYPDKWRSFLGTAIERHIDALNFYLDPEEELALLEELDSLLADANTVAIRLRRLTNRRRVARLYIQENELEAAGQTVGECTRLIKAISSGSPKLAADQLEQVLAAEVEASLFRGEIAEKQENWSKAFYELSSGLSRLSEQDLGGRTEFARLAFELHNRLARMPPDVLSPGETAEHAVLAARYGALQAPGSLVTQFVDLARVIITAGDPDQALEFCEYALDGQDRRLQGQSGNYWGRLPRPAASFFQAAADLVWLLTAAPKERSAQAIVLIGETAVLVWRTLGRRHTRMSENMRLRESVSDPIVALVEALASTGASSEIAAQLRDAAAISAGRRPAPKGS
jgi:hypothetical protein